MSQRSWFRFFGIVMVACATSICAERAESQNPPRPTTTQAGRGGRAERAPDYPVRPPAPAAQPPHAQSYSSSPVCLR